MWGLFLCLLDMIGLSPVRYCAFLIGTSEPSLRLLISILMGYPLACIYHKYIREHVHLRHIYFVLMGFDMAFYNFGAPMYHNAIPVLLIYLTTKIFGPGKLNAIVTFVLNMTYLLAGYIVTESEEYDITWTMPQCVLTLKLIALSFDLWDGHNVETKCKKSALDSIPTLLELLGFVYFPACFLVGPIFSFRRYKDFITDKYPLDTEATVYHKQAIIKLLQGIAYLIAFQVGVTVFNMKYMQSEQFWDTSIFYRHMYCGMWGHFALYKYIACWLLTEASCIRFGLSYNGRDEDSVSRWDGCNNIKLVRFESATKFQHYIDSFNCNTNHFAAEYIYKRLKFLGNRNLSQLFTLLFLSLWHGTRSGYYMTFFNEFIIIYMEKGLESLLSRTQLYHHAWANGPAKCLMYLLLKLYTIVFMGWSLVPFDLKVYTKWLPLYYSLYFSGFLLFLPWPLIYKPMLCKILKNVDVVKTE